MSDAINATPWDAGTPVTLSATHSSNTFTVNFQPGTYGAAADANMCAIFEQHKTSTATITPSGRTAISGGVDSTSVHISIPFSTVFGAKVTTLRQLWVTFAPLLTNGTAYADQEWTAIATNWAITDPGGKRPLKIAGAGSVRIDSRDPGLPTADRHGSKRRATSPAVPVGFRVGSRIGRMPRTIRRPSTIPASTFMICTSVRRFTRIEALSRWQSTEAEPALWIVFYGRNLRW